MEISGGGGKGGVDCRVVIRKADETRSTVLKCMRCGLPMQSDACRGGNAAYDAEVQRGCGMLGAWGQGMIG